MSGYLGFIASTTSVLLAAAILASCSGAIPDSPARFKKRGDDLASRQQFTEAADEYEKALRLDPAYAQAHYALGRVLTRLGHINDGATRFALAAVTFGTSKRLREFSGEAPLPDLDPPEGSLREFVIMAIRVEEQGQKIWIDPYQSLGLALIDYDAEGKKLDDQLKKQLLLRQEDRLGLLPEGVLAGVSEETRQRLELGLQVIRIVQVHEALRERMGDAYDAPVKFQLAFENEEWCDAAEQLRRLTELQTDQAAKTKGQALLVKLQQRCGQ
jgi:tetratricopeptide (TPR) repeat protein